MRKTEINGSIPHVIQCHRPINHDLILDQWFLRPQHSISRILPLQPFIQ
jgi:hypothetical protein